MQTSGPGPLLPPPGAPAPISLHVVPACHSRPEPSRGPVAFQLPGGPPSLTTGRLSTSAKGVGSFAPPNFCGDIWGTPPGETRPGAKAPRAPVHQDCPGGLRYPWAAGSRPSLGARPALLGLPILAPQSCWGLRAMNPEGCSHSTRSDAESFIRHLINVALGSRSPPCRSRAVGCEWGVLSCPSAGGGDATGGLRPRPCVTVTVAPRIYCPALVAFVANLLGAVLSFTCIPANTKGARAPDTAAPPGKAPRRPRRAHQARDSAGVGRAASLSPASTLDLRLGPLPGPSVQ